ncbi:enoyl-CoA hydratase/isomerase family protein [Chloroflexota bacterium]
MSYQAISYQKRGHIGYITLNRPEVANAISIQMAIELEGVCQRINQDEDARVVIISGSGEESFCCGEDLSQICGPASDELPSLTELKEFTLRYNVGAMIAGIHCPVIAAINGDASGTGLALAMSSDLRIASDRALFDIPDVARGCLLANGITQVLPRIVGRGKAMELILTAEHIDAGEAKRIGLIHRVVPHQEVSTEADKLAGDIARGAPIALRYAKEVINKGMDLTLEQGLRMECDLYMVLQTTRDRTEGIMAFREKRQPLFRGE